MKGKQMKLYLIRHGESETNLSGHYTGWSQVQLTEKGIEDAKGIRPLLEKVKFDKIYSSDLIRAKMTAETAIPGCVYEETELLREMNVGDLALKPFLPKEGKERELLVDGYNHFGGESFAEFRVRVGKFLDKVAASEHEYVAAFTHAGFLRNTLSLVLDAKTTHSNLECSNCAVAIIECIGGTWRLSCWINPQ